MERAKVRVLLVDDHRLFAESLSIALRSLGEFDIVGTASSTGEMLQLARACRPDLIISDIDLPSGLVFLTVEQVAQDLPDTKVLLLSAFHSETLLELSLRAKVQGYLLKTESIEFLLSAISAVARGERRFSPVLVEQMEVGVDGVLRVKHPVPLGELTIRQVEVLKHLAKGLSVKEIAREMSLSAKTVDSHKYRIMKTLNVHDRVQLAQLAWDQRLIGMCSTPAAVASGQS